MSDKLGSRLRQIRERQHIALGSIARDTKIGLPLLEALERDDVSHWPAGIFRRSFIRAYAHAIGLDPDSIVSEFLEQFPDPGEPVSPASIVAARGAALSGRERPPTRLDVLWKAAVGCGDTCFPAIAAWMRSVVAGTRGGGSAEVHGSGVRPAVASPFMAPTLQCAEGVGGVSQDTSKRSLRGLRPLVLTVRIVSNQSPFERGKVIQGLWRRGAAAACDAGMLIFVALAMVLILDSFWTSFAVSAVCYYLASVIILGNTPGVCLCAPLDRAQRRNSPAQAMPRTQSAPAPIASA